MKLSHPKFTFPKVRFRLPKITRFRLILALLAFIFFASLPFLTHFIATQSYKSQMYTDINKVPQNYSALILGAGVWKNGEPSPILYDRIEAGVKLYKAGKVKKLIVSGDNRFSHYNEPEVMKKVAVQMGVPEKDIQEDFAGRRTYDSCWRAENIFSQEKTIIVTQSFHMTRALFLCNKLGVQSVGFISDVNRYSQADWNKWTVRDKISFNLSLIDIYFKSPKVVKGDKISL